jgi:hypothetical protein
MLALLRVVLAGFLLAHVGITLLYLLPPNPIKLRLAPLLARVMHPFFAQDWRLFAPEPISDTRRLWLSCRLRQSDGATLETAWVDVTSPWWQAQTHNRFSPAAWLSRPQAYALQLYIEEDRIVQQQRRALGRRLLARLGAAYCDRRYGVGRTGASRFCLEVLRFPPFSQRYLDDSAGSRHWYRLEWLPYESVAPLAPGQP